MRSSGLCNRLLLWCQAHGSRARKLCRSSRRRLRRGRGSQDYHQEELKENWAFFHNHFYHWSVNVIGGEFILRFACIANGCQHLLLTTKTYRQKFGKELKNFVHLCSFVDVFLLWQNNKVVKMTERSPQNGYIVPLNISMPISIVKFMLYFQSQRAGAE